MANPSDRNPITAPVDQDPDFDITRTHEYWFPSPKPSATLTEHTENETTTSKEPIGTKSNEEQSKSNEARITAYQEASRNHPWRQSQYPSATNVVSGRPMRTRLLEVRGSAPTQPAKPIRAPETRKDSARKDNSALVPTPIGSVEKTSVPAAVKPSKRPRTPSTHNDKDNGIIDRGNPVAKKQARLPSYSNRQELARRMQLGPEHRMQMRARRSYIKLCCMRLGHKLERPFSSWPPAEMDAIVDAVTIKVQKILGETWTPDLTKDLIHAICLDTVRNQNVKEKRIRELATERQLNTGRQPTTVVEVVAANDNQAVTTMEPRNRSNLLSSEPGNTSLISQQFSPRAPVTDISIPNHNANSQSPPNPNNSPAGSSNTNTYTVLAPRPSTIPVYTANRSPFYAPTDAGINVFFGSVSHALTWTENESLFYCPAGIEPIVWMPVRTELEFSTMFNTCYSGVFLKIVANYWYKAEAEYRYDY